MTDTWGLDAQMARDLLARAEKAEAERDRAVELLAIALVQYPLSSAWTNDTRDFLDSVLGLATEESNE
jgi:hypothetical protein